MSEHHDGVIEAARTIDNSLSNHGDNRSAGIAEVNAYLAKNPTLINDPERAKALSQELAKRGDLPDMIIGEFSKSPADRANDPLAKLLHPQQSLLGSSESEIQTNAAGLAQGQAAREGLNAFTPDQWNQIFKGGSASHDDVQNALKDKTLNLTEDQTKALTDLDKSFDSLRVSGWHIGSDRHKISRDRLQYDLDSRDGGILGKELGTVDGLQTKAEQVAKAGHVVVNVESGEGWQNVAAKALGYDLRLKTQSDWDAVPQADINKIYGLADYFAQHNPSMLHAGKLELKVPEKFQTS